MHRYSREAGLGAGYAALYCAVRGATESAHLAALYYAVVAAVLVAWAQKLTSADSSR